MPSFTGEYRHTIDAKGRLIVPARLRAALEGDRVVLSGWLDDSIALWSEASWADIEQRLRSQNAADPAARAFVRYVAGSAWPETIDKQGRIGIPQPLRERVGIDRDVVVSGAFDHAEIWSPEKYEQQQAMVEAGRLEELAAELNLGS